jgi:Coenzyme PQQ synthesis protein D (PqqD)
VNRRSLAHERELHTRSLRAPECAARHASRIGTAAFLDGVVVHDGHTGRLFQLNRTAAQIWRSLRQGDPEEAVVSAIASTHGADPTAVRRDVEAFIQAARSAGLLGPSLSEVGDEAMELPSPRGRPALDGAYRVGEVVVRVSCYPAEVAAAFAPLAAPAVVADVNLAQARMVLRRAGDDFVLTCDGRVVDRLDTAPAARWATETPKSRCASVRRMLPNRREGSSRAAQARPRGSAGSGGRIGTVRRPG